MQVVIGFSQVDLIRTSSQVAQEREASTGCRVWTCPMVSQHISHNHALNNCHDSMTNHKEKYPNINIVDQL